MPRTEIQGLPDVRKIGEGNWRFGVYIKRPGDSEFSPIPNNAVKTVEIEYNIQTTAITGRLVLENEGNRIAEMFPLLGSEQWHIKIHPYEVDLFKDGLADTVDKLMVEYTFDTLNLMLPELEGVGVGHSRVDIDLVDVDTNLLKQSGSTLKYIPARVRSSDWLKEQIERILGPNVINQDRWYGSESALEYPKQISWDMFSIMHQLKHGMYSGDDNMYFLFRDRYGLFCLEPLNNILKKPYHRNILRFKDASLGSDAGAGMLHQNVIQSAGIDTFDLTNIEDGFHGYSVRSFKPMAKRFFGDVLTVKSHVEDSKSKIGPGASLIHPDFSKSNNIKTRIVPWKNKPTDRLVPYRRAMFAHTTFNAFNIDATMYHGALDQFVGNVVSLTVPSGLTQQKYNEIYSGAYLSVRARHIWTDLGYKSSMTLVKNAIEFSQNKGYFNER